MNLSTSVRYSSLFDFLVAAQVLGSTESVSRRTKQHRKDDTFPDVRAQQWRLFKQAEFAELLDGALVGMRNDGLENVDYLRLNVVIEQVEVGYQLLLQQMGLDL